MACLAASRMGAQAATAAAEDFLSRSMRRANPLRYYRPVVLVTGLTDDGRFGVVQGRHVRVEHLVPAWFVGRASRNSA
jgi:Mismatch repair ATPase (MutS family)